MEGDVVKGRERQRGIDAGKMANGSSCGGMGE